jgi:hypothetical protein
MGTTLAGNTTLFLRGRMGSVSSSPLVIATGIAHPW